MITSVDIEPANGKGPAKAKIFISYSRKDLAFADRLEAGLTARGFDTLIDRSEIYALEDWWKRIEALITQADTMVFVLSLDAASSVVCLREVGFAGSLNKRLAPVVHRRVENSAVPEALARLNYIFFDDEASFEESMNLLVAALETDIDWVRKHTEFGQYALRWSAAGRPGPRGLLLRSPALEEAERWIASRPQGAPAPTEAAQAFIAESRRAATRRRNILSGSLAAGLLVTLALADLPIGSVGSLSSSVITHYAISHCFLRTNLGSSARRATLAQQFCLRQRRFRMLWPVPLDHTYPQRRFSSMTLGAARANGWFSRAIRGPCSAQRTAPTAGTSSQRRRTIRLGCGTPKLASLSAYSTAITVPCIARRSAPMASASSQRQQIRRRGCGTPKPASPLASSPATKAM